MFSRTFECGCFLYSENHSIVRVALKRVTDREDQKLYASEYLFMTVGVVVNIYNLSINNFQEHKLKVTKEISSIFLEKEPTIELLLAILSSNNLYADELQKIAEDIANQTEVIYDE